MRRSLGSTFRIETRFPLGLKRVLSDANQLEMALLNLAVNARDAMEDGGEIIISAQQEKSCRQGRCRIETWHLRLP